MIDSKIDEQLQRFSSAVAHATSDPLPISEPSGTQRSWKPVLAFASAFVVVMITLGIGAFAVSWSRSSDSTHDSAASSYGIDGDIGAYWEWLTTDAVPLEDGVVGVTQSGPEPNFDPSDLGEVQRLLSHSEFPFVGELNFEGEFPLVESEFVPPVAFIGTLEGTSRQLMLYRAVHTPTGDLSLCLDQRITDRVDIWCSAHIDLINDGFPWGVEHDVDPTSGSIIRVIMEMLPSQTAVVVVTSADGRAFVQRPVGGVAVIEFVESGESLPISIEALDEDGSVLARDGFYDDTLPKGGPGD